MNTFYKMKIGRANKGRKLGPLSVEQKENLSKVFSNMIWITDGQTSKRIPKESSIPEGFRRGRI